MEIGKTFIQIGNYVQISYNKSTNLGCKGNITLFYKE